MLRLLLLLPMLMQPLLLEFFDQFNAFTRFS